MQENVYAAPESSFEEPKIPAKQAFYVVSKTKFWVLFISTFGYYSVYWHFKNWKLYKDFHKESMIPVMRALFSIFFTHVLFNKVDADLKAKSKKFNWMPDLWATVVVIAVIAARILDRLYSNDKVSDLMFAVVFLFMAIQGLALFKAQLAINLSCDDPTGSSNSNFTILN